MDKQRTHSHALHVLLVDDASVVRDGVTVYLASEGHTVESAINGREGLEKFKGGRFDVVVTDREMPEMNGEQLAAAIKQIAPDMPIILFTGKPPSEKPSGVDLIVHKSCRPVEALQEALEKVSSS